MTKQRKFLVPMSILFLFCMLSCDSLWNVRGTTNITMDMDLSGLLTQRNAVLSNRYAQTPNVIDSDDNEETITAKVAIIDSTSNAVISEKIITIDDDYIENGFKVDFEDMPIGKSVVAQVHISHNSNELLSEAALTEGVVLDDTYFLAKSSSAVVLKDGENIIPVKPNAVFLLPGEADEYIDDISGENDATGLTPYDPVNNLQTAYNILGGKNASEGATIFIMDTIYSDVEPLRSMQGITLKRFKSTKELIAVTSSFGVTIGEIIIDGNKENINATNALITVDGAYLILNATTLQNSRVFTDSFITASAIEVDAGQMEINSATIAENESISKGSDPTNQSNEGVGGAVSVSTAGKLLLTDGIISITGNRDIKGENNIYYEISDIVSSSYHNIRATKEFHQYSLLGITPYTYDEIAFTYNNPANDAFLIWSENSSDSPYFTLENFILNIEGDLYIDGSSLRYKAP